MISVEQLREYQAEFEQIRLSNHGKYKEREQLRRDFERRFPRKEILLLTPDGYAQGKGNKQAFCYWIEWKLSELGHIQGTPAKKFGAFFSKKTGSLQFTKEFQRGQNPFPELLQEIANLLDAAEIDDIERVRSAKISPMFKGKLLFLYFPRKFLNIYSERHIDHFLRQLRLNEPGAKLDLISKRETLVKFKDGDEWMKHWSMFEFHDFLYEKWGSPVSQTNMTPLLKSYVLDLPPPESVRPEFISLALGNADNTSEYKFEKSSGVIDFDFRNRRNKMVGNQGEDIVFLVEKQELRRKGRPDLAERVTLVSATDDNAGFDVLSFELDGKPKRIEVKSTVGRPPKPNSNFTFFLSANEYEQASRLDNYYLYIVFDVTSKTPKIWPIRDPATLTPRILDLKPSSYMATVTVV